ncbi:dihydrodipicolinate reductase [Chloroflexota bacterium]
MKNIITGNAILERTAEMEGKIRFVQMGLGPVGAKICKLALEKEGFEIVGVIEKVNLGKDVGEVIGLDKKLNITLTEDVNKALVAKPDIVLHSTLSSLAKVREQLLPIIKAGVNIVSTCEELSYPWSKYPEIAKELDNLAKVNNVTVLGTGVNPGFLMDAWPLFMTGVCQQVKRIKAVRIQDASSRRGPFQKKIGAGCTIKEFKERVFIGTLRHVGLAESIAMIAGGLGWKLDDIAESIEPVIAKNKVKTDFVTVEPGQVAGVRQVGRGIGAGEELIILEFEASVGASESYDAVYITGTPNMEVIIKEGTPGDIATAAMVINSVLRVIQASPGLITMKDLPLVSAMGAST